MAAPEVIQTQGPEKAVSAVKRVLILGGGYAGLMAARRLAHHTHRQPVEITLINGTSRFVERIRLHQTAAAGKLRSFTVPQMLGGARVRFVEGWVTAIDPEQQRVTVRLAGGPAGGTQYYDYDYMVYALGSIVDLSGVAGAAENALSVAGYEQTLALKDRLMALSRAHGQVVIVGGGLTGIEIATETAERYPGLHVTLMTRGRFGAQFSPKGEAYVRGVFDRLKIEVIEHTDVRRIHPDRVEYLAEGAADEKSLASDLTIWAGAFGVPTLARDSGLAVNARGQVIVDAHLRSLSYPNIYAVGDSANPSDAIGMDVDMGCKTALPMGGYAGDDLAARLAGRTWKPFDYGYIIYCVSLGRHAGLIQLYQPEGEIKNQVITGWLGAKIKEMICQSTVWQVRHPRWMLYTSRPEALRPALYQGESAASVAG